MKNIFTLHIFLVILVFGCIGTKKKKDLSKEKETKTLVVNKTNSASYSDVDVSGNTSYTDVTHAA